MGLIKNFWCWLFHTERYYDAIHGKYCWICKKYLCVVTAHKWKIWKLKCSKGCDQITKYYDPNKRREMRKENE